MIAILAAASLALSTLAVPVAAAADPVTDGLERLERGDERGAQIIFAELARLYPEEALPHYYAGVAAARLGDPAGAVEAFSRAAAIDPGFPWLQANLGIALYRTGDLAGAEIHLLEALLQGPDDSDVLLHLGLIDLESGEPLRAARLFEESAALDPEVAALPLFHLARARLEVGDIGGALAAIERALDAPGPGSVRIEARTLRAELEALAPRPQRVALQAGAGIEFSDNLTVNEIDRATGIADYAGVFDLRAQLSPVQGRYGAISIGYDFYQSLYDRVAELDFQSHAPAVMAFVEIGRIRPHAVYRYGVANLGGMPFLNEHRVVVGSELELRPGWYADLGFEFDDLDFAVDNPRDATRVSFYVAQRVEWMRARTSFFATWQPEWQDARSFFFDYESHRLRISSVTRLPAPPFGLDLNLSYEYRRRFYPDNPPDALAPLVPKRLDQRHILGAGLIYPLMRMGRATTEVTFDYLFISSRGNRPGLSYDENVVTLRFGVWL